MWIFITGNPVDGFQYTGPFDSSDAVIEAGEYADGDWWIVKLESPEDYKEPDMSEQRVSPIYQAVLEAFEKGTPANEFAVADKVNYAWAEEMVNRNDYHLEFSVRIKADLRHNADGSVFLDYDPVVDANLVLRGARRFADENDLQGQSNTHEWMIIRSTAHQIIEQQLIAGQKAA